VRSKTFAIAPTGAVVNSLGACAWVACPTITASGARPRFSERRLERGDFFQVGLERLLVGLDELLFLAGLDGDRRGLPGEPAFGIGLLRPL
jgi:hypothetical protein